MLKTRLSFLLLAFTGLMMGCNSNPPLPVTTQPAVAQVLLDAGDRLGVDFTNPLFADQTVCHDQFDKHYGNEKFVYGLICAKLKSQHVNIFWVRSHVFEDNFSKRNALGIAELNSVPASDIVVTFQKRDQNKYYHLVKIGSVMSFYRGFFFHRTEKSNKLGLGAVVLVKAARLEDAEKLLQQLELAVAGVQNTASATN